EYRPSARTVLNEYRPKSAGDFVPATFESRACLLSGVGRVGISTECADRFEYTLEIVEPARVLIELFYYPGWVIRVDEKPVSFERDGWGRPLLELPQGRWRLSGVFEKTSLRAWADGVSILAVLGLVLGWFLGKKTAKMAP
ncbi:MAG: hypothetical protein WCG06_05330, partial [Candidatus Omnitrophota bacterium]